LIVDSISRLPTVIPSHRNSTLTAPQQSHAPCPASRRRSFLIKLANFAAAALSCRNQEWRPA
jgi:hypothetical protein